MQDLCVTATRDHNVYASFRPSIATKDAETRSKMNTDKQGISVIDNYVLLKVCLHFKNRLKYMHASLIGI